MSRRGRSGPTISLFSFQDIITSVTAIVTVITLLLALDLVQRKESQASDSSASVALELVKRLERAESELAQLRAISDSTDDLVREVAATSPGELQNEIAERESKIVELEREKARLERQETLWKAREKEELARQFDLEPLKQEQANAELAIIDLERQRLNENEENRVVFSLPRGMEKEGWLAVIDSEQIFVAPLGRPAKPTMFVTTGQLLVRNSAADNFEAWILKNRLNSAYFLLLIRPGSSEEFDHVQKKLAAQKIAHGFDLISADQNILHPERGAAP